MSSTPEKPKILVILGPTASGKSDLAIKLAKKFNGEVISADSRQVYKGLDIGTGKVTKREAWGVHHHLIDITSPRRVYSAALYHKDATKIIGQIVSKNKLPIICGGTGFYIDTLLGSVSIPNVPVNEKLRKILSEKSKDELIAILTLLDKERAKSVDRQNPVRLIRAIEIASALGHVPNLGAQVSNYDVLKIGIKTPPDILKHEIYARLLRRMKKGMVAEGKRLHSEGVTWKRMEALGLEYRYLAKYLKGEITKKEMLEKLNTEIWQYAKRQITWFKRDKKINWIPVGEVAQAEKLVKKFLN